VRSVAAAPSMLAIGSVCKSQNLGERKSTSSTVRAVIGNQVWGNDDTPVIHVPYALPIALARSYESLVRSEMEKPSTRWVKRTV
jgi:hypothetical protein